MKTISVGTIVYFEQKPFQSIHQGIVTAIYSVDRNKSGQSHRAVTAPISIERDENGKLYDDMPNIIVYVRNLKYHWTATMFLSAVYLDELEARSAMYSKYQKILEEYMESIQTVEDLIRFPAENVICGEDGNPEAALAYKLRAKDLLGIDVHIGTSLLFRPEQ